MLTPTQLNHSFAIPDHLHFETGPGGWLVGCLRVGGGEVRVCLQGGQVLSWRPVGQRPVLWLSEEARFQEGKAIRGGMPVCWPWFGPHGMSQAPSHGLARTAPWQVLGSARHEDGAVSLTLGFATQAEGQAYSSYWPHASAARLQVRLGERLSVHLHSHNLGQEAFPLSEALHTYFQVSDISQITVHGLDGAEYVDQLTGSRQQQSGPVHFAAEVDRVYVGSPAHCWIDDAAWQRRLHIRTSGSQSTIVWNPWQAKAERLGDMGQDGYRHMLCIESGNALDNTLSLAPGAEHMLTVDYELETLAR